MLWRVSVYSINWGGGVDWVASHPPFGEAKKKDLKIVSEYYDREKGKHS